MKKIITILIITLGILTINVDAKEIDIYFYPNGGSVTTNNFNINSYGYINYNNSDYYAKYTDKNTIKNINSIEGKIFSVKKNKTSQVKGREWYFYNYEDGKYYYFNEAKTYKVNSILEQLGVYDSFYSIDLYANWESNKKTGGIDIKTGGSNESTTTTPTKNNKKATSFSISTKKTKINIGKSTVATATFKPSGAKSEKITWTSSNKKIATVDKNGKIIGIKKGTATITASTKKLGKKTIKITVTKKHNVHIKYNANGGKIISDKQNLKIKNNIIKDETGNSLEQLIPNEEKLTSNGLIDTNNPNYLELSKANKIIEKGKEWNTKKNGKGKTYSQDKQYDSSEFCDSSNKDCDVTLYANWQNHSFDIYAYTEIKGPTAQYFDVKNGYIYLSKPKKSSCKNNNCNNNKKDLINVKTVDIYRYKKDNSKLLQNPEKMTITNSGHGTTFHVLNNGKLLVGISNSNKNNGLKKLSNGNWIGNSSAIGIISFKEGTIDATKIKNTINFKGKVVSIDFDEEKKIMLISGKIYKYTNKNNKIIINKNNIEKINKYKGGQGSAFNKNTFYHLKNDKFQSYKYNRKIETTYTINKEKIQKALNNANIELTLNNKNPFEPEGIKIINKKIYIGVRITDDKGKRYFVLLIAK